MRAIDLSVRRVLSFSRLSYTLGLLLTLATGLAEAKTVTIDEYLSSVRETNQTLKIATTSIQAGELRSTTPDLIFSPQFFSQASHTVDSKESTNPLAPDKIEATSLSFGIQKLWESGLQSQVSFNMTHVNLDQARLPGFIPVPLSLPNPLVPGTTLNQIVNVPNPVQGLLPPSEYTDARTQIDLVQPLWKNAGGTDSSLTRDAVLTKISMQQLGERYKVKSLLAQAEFVYWQLALAQEAVRTQEGSIERFKKIKEWARGRAQSQLGDKADFLQADSGLKVKILELEQAKKERSSLRRMFNTLRGMPGDVVQDDLQPLSSQFLKGKEVSKTDDPSPASSQTVKRLDIEIAKQAERLASIDVAASREKYRAQLDVFGSVAFNALENTSEQALTGALQNEHPTYVVGLKFSTPLDHDIINRDREGLVKTGEAAKLDKELKQFTADQEWADLQTQLSEAKFRLSLADEIEKAQKEKLAYEKQRLSIGRTTTYQVLMFEQDYAASQLNAIKSKAEILGLLARLKSFGDAT